MKKLSISIVFLLFVSTLSAQEVISSQGETYSNANGSMDFTVGEVVINTGTNGTNDLTQGFHQTNWNLVGVEDFAPNYEATIFPNPTQDVLNIKSTRGFRHVSIKFVVRCVIPKWRKMSARYVVQILRG